MNPSYVPNLFSDPLNPTGGGAVVCIGLRVVFTMPFVFNHVNELSESQYKKSRSLLARSGSVAASYSDGLHLHPAMVADKGIHEARVLQLCFIYVFKFSLTK
jgi:hypothetical protein